MTVIRSGGAPLFGLPPGVVLVLLLAALLCAGCASRNESPENVRSRNLQEDMATLESVALGKFKDKDKPAEPPPASAREPEAVKPARPLLPNPLSLSQAVDYALRNNLQALVAEQERQTLNETANSAMVRMLPSLLAEVEQSWKSRHIPSFSESFKTGQQTLEPSISSDLRTNTYDVTFSWDVLNTAINAIHWRQARKATEAAGERLRRVKQGRGPQGHGGLHGGGGCPRDVQARGGRHQRGRGTYQDHRPGDQGGPGAAHPGPAEPAPTSWRCASVSTVSRTASALPWPD